MRETDRVDTPVSLYAATKRADELMSHAYGHLFGMPADRVAVFHGLWAVGPAGHGLLQLRPGDRRRRADHAVRWRGLRRDFTYIDDIVAGVLGVLDHPPDGGAPVRVLNIGNHRSEQVSDADRRAGAGAGPDRRGALGAAAAGGCGGNICRRSTRSAR